MKALMMRSVLVVAMAGLGACAGVRDHRGFIMDAQLAKSVETGIDNKQSVEKTLGRPTFTGQFNDNDWFYLAQDTTTLAFRNPQVNSQTLIHVQFDQAGNVAAVKTSDKSTIISIDPEGDKTPTLGRKKSFFEELFSNIGTVAQPGLGGQPGQ